MLAPLFGFLLLQVLRLKPAVPSYSVRSAPDVGRREPASGLPETVVSSVFTSMSPTLCLQSADPLELFSLPISRSLEPFLGEAAVRLRLDSLSSRRTQKTHVIAKKRTQYSIDTDMKQTRNCGDTCESAVKILCKTRPRL